ncbi:MAG: class I SAM-dependent rRNA methyltransferase [Spirochaetaceae bacterium]|jgi:23S rRNA (cytosine1962-C5)-methyltransferase|nr:class I SAM-dependent rRNA methyltransferase [Spirochaetaceae bacterium]
MRSIKRIVLKKGEEGRIRLGHPWVFDNEVGAVLEGFGSAAKPAALEAGGIADVESSRKEYLGRAFVNPHSKIVARIYSPSKEGVDAGFFKRRIRQALARRELCGLAGKSGLAGESGRLVFAEADALPGLIIDRYLGWPLDESLLPSQAMAITPPQTFFAVQFLTAAMDARREMICAALGEVFSGAPGFCVIEKSMADVRRLEGLPLCEAVLAGDAGSGAIVVRENGNPLVARLLGGQKTGLFLDQRENHRRAAVFARALAVGNAAGAGAGEERPLRVLDAFCYTGGFSVAIVRALRGAQRGAEIHACDSSEAALEDFRLNARLNDFNANLVHDDVFSFLSRCERGKERFDMVVLDPPAFAKTHGVLANAISGYREINAKAIKVLRTGGMLVSCSCSQALDAAAFRRVLTQAALEAGRRLRCLDFTIQSPDHPVLLGYDESLYLKAAFCVVE